MREKGKRSGLQLKNKWDELLFPVIVGRPLKGKLGSTLSFMRTPVLDSGEGLGFPTIFDLYTTEDQKKMIWEELTRNGESDFDFFELDSDLSVSEIVKYLRVEDIIRVAMLILEMLLKFKFKF